MKIKTLGWLISPCIALAACTETALDYRSAEGTVVIAPEWGAFACPATACYRFYADNGEAVAGFGTDAAASVGYFSTTLPVGSYHLLAYNTDAHALLLQGWRAGMPPRSVWSRRCSPAMYIAGMWTMWTFRYRVRCNTRPFRALW